MIKVVIIGYGNVASHLYNVFSKTDVISISKINSRNIKDIPDSDIIIIAVSDDAISEVSNQLKNNNSLIAHTSGTVSLDAIKSKRKGVFYPLQTFTKEKSIDFSKVPFCIEATNDTDLQILTNLAGAIDAKTYQITTAQRKKLHIAAVFVNNFSNHMYTIGKEICDQHQVPFEILLPLIKETANKITEISPAEAQTGPGKRNDEQTIKNHLEQLNSQQQEIYSLITKSIQEN